MTEIQVIREDEKATAILKVIRLIDEGVEVGQVAHGRWIGLEADGYADGFPVYDLWECSVCGEEVSGEDVPETHYFCYSCGAKMDLEDAYGQN